MGEIAEMLTCGLPCDGCPIAELRNQKGDVVAMRANRAVDHTIVAHGAEMTSQTDELRLNRWAAEGDYSQGIEPGSDAGKAAAAAVIRIARLQCQNYSVADL